MSDKVKTFCGYSLNGRYTVLTIWEFCGNTKEHLATIKSNASKMKGASRRTRFDELCKLLTAVGIAIPEYKESGK